LNEILNIVSLCVGYDKKPVISDFNTRISSPSLVTLIGRNGEGKSTLLKTITGLLPSFSGNISFFNKEISSLSTKEKSTIFSIVLAQPPQIGNITVRDFVGFGRYPYTNWLAMNSKKDNTIIDESLALCGLTDFAQRNFANLSDGEKQKIAIARAIAQNTPVIILDEPTSHLDMVNQIEIFELLHRLVKEKQKTILISSHQLQLAMHYSDEIWLLNQGEIEINAPTFFMENKTIEQLFRLENKFKLW